MFDVARLLIDYGVDVSFGGKNVKTGSVGVCCPYCGDTSFHGAFPPDGKWYSCWKCGKHPVHETIQIITGLGKHEFYQIKDQYDSILDRPVKKITAQAEKIDLSVFEPLNKACKKYLLKRGFDPEYVEKKYSLLYGGIVDKDFKYKIILPVFDSKNRLVSYQGRDITDKAERRYNSLDVTKSVVNIKECLYGEQWIPDYTIGAVTEGPFDKMRVDSNRMLASLGTSMSEVQVRKLSKFKKLFIVNDPEEEAQERAFKYAEQVSALGCNVEVVNTEWDHDLGDATEEEIDYLKRELGL